MRPPSFQNPLPGVPDIESPFFEAIFAGKQLDPETRSLVQQIRDQGYAVLRFPEDEFDRLASDLIRDVNKDRVQDAWQTNALVRRIATHPRILQILEAMYGRRPIPFQTLNFNTGTEQTTHSDIVHFSSMPERFMCGVWVALEDMDEDNGPLRYYPGTHKWPSFGNENIGALIANMEHLDNYPAYERLWQQLIDQSGIAPQTLTGKRGTTLIWAANLLHGGSPKRDRNRTRHSQVTHYYFDNCAYYTPLNSDIPYGHVFYRHITDITTGQIVQNKVCGQPVSRRHLDRSLDYGVYRYGGLSLRKLLGGTS